MVPSSGYTNESDTKSYLPNKAKYLFQYTGINTGGGDDSISVSGNIYKSELILGSGNDSLIANNSGATPWDAGIFYSTIDAGEGNDYIEASTVTSGSTIIGGSGFDVLYLKTWELQNPIFKNDLKLQGIYLMSPGNMFNTPINGEQGLIISGFEKIKFLDSEFYLNSKIFGGKIYTLIDASTYQSAVNKANELGGYLQKSETKAESAFVYNAFAPWKDGAGIKWIGNTHWYGESNTLGGGYSSVDLTTAIVESELKTTIDINPSEATIKIGLSTGLGNHKYIVNGHKIYFEISGVKEVLWPGLAKKNSSYVGEAYLIDGQVSLLKYIGQDQLITVKIFSDEAMNDEIGKEVATFQSFKTEDISKIPQQNTLSSSPADTQASTKQAETPKPKVNNQKTEDISKIPQQNTLSSSPADTQASTKQAETPKPKVISGNIDDYIKNNSVEKVLSDLTFKLQQLGPQYSDTQEALNIIWSKINLGAASSEEKKSIDWKSVSKLDGSYNSSLSATDLYQINVASSLSGSYTSSTNWSQIKVGEFSKDTYAKTDWSQVKIGDIKQEDIKNVNWSSVAVNSILKEEFKKLDWSSVKTSTFSAETYSQLDWSIVKVGAFSQESKKTLDWQKVKIGGADGASTESLSTTDLFQYNAANGKAVVDYKKTNFNEFKFAEFSETSYEAINWSKVNFKSITAETYSQMDFSEVITSKGFSAATYKSVDWSKVDYGDFKAETYQKTDWSKVTFGKLSSSSYSAMDWSQVVTSTGFKAATYKAVNWGLVDFGDYKAETYQKTDWSKVNFKQFTASSYSSIDWSQVITATGFNATAYKSVNWGQVDFGDFKQQTFATTNWNQVNFKQLSTSQYQAINWNEINLGALSTKTYKAIDWKKVNVAAFDAESLSTAKWGLMKGVTKPIAAAKPAESDLSFLGVAAPTGSSAGLVGAAGQSSSNQVVAALTAAQKPAFL